jgi:hypothetical protein
MDSALLFMVHRCSFAEGTGGGGFAPSDADGRRKGKAPLGDAWLLEEVIWKSMPENFMYAFIESALLHLDWVEQRFLTCHFKQPGLYDGAPFAASRSLANTYSVCAARLRGARCGSSFAAYVKMGNLSKSCFIGVGTENKLREGCAAGRRASWGT